MKKPISIVLILCLLISLCACGGNKTADGSSSLNPSSVPYSSNLGSQTPTPTPPIFDFDCDHDKSFISTLNEVVDKSEDKAPKDCITVAYPEKELVSFIEVLNFDGGTTLHQLNERFPLEYVVIDNSMDGEAGRVNVYSFVYELKEGGYLQGFAFTQTRLFGDCILIEKLTIINDQITTADFDSIKSEKSTLRDVEKLDTTSARLNELSDQNFSAKFYHVGKGIADGLIPYTVHATADGLVSIEYLEKGGEYVVQRVQKFGDLVADNVSVHYSPLNFFNGFHPVKFDEIFYGKFSEGPAPFQ